MPIGKAVQAAASVARPKAVHEDLKLHLVKHEGRLVLERPHGQDIVNLVDTLLLQRVPLPPGNAWDLVFKASMAAIVDVCSSQDPEKRLFLAGEFLPNQLWGTGNGELF